MGGGIADGADVLLAEEVIELGEGGDVAADDVGDMLMSSLA